jgi:hypothetical protein
MLSKLSNLWCFPHQLTLSRNSRRVFSWAISGALKSSWIAVAEVQSCVRRSAKTLGLRHLQIPGMATNSGSPDATCIIRHWSCLWNSALFVMARPLLLESSKHAQFLSCLWTRLMCADQVTLRYRAVRNHCTGLGLCVRLSVLSVLCETLTAVVQSSILLRLLRWSYW